MIEYGADINKKNVNGISILDLAIKDKNKEIVDILIHAGAQMKPLRIFYDVVEENHLKISPTELEQLLVSNLIDLDETENSGYSEHNILTYLLDVGPEKNLWDPREQFNREPEEKREMIKNFKSVFDILIRFGIDVNFKTANGRSALDGLLSGPIKWRNISSNAIRCGSIFNT